MKNLQIYWLFSFSVCSPIEHLNGCIIRYDEKMGAHCILSLAVWINLKHFSLEHREEMLTKMETFYVPFNFMSGKMYSNVRLRRTITLSKDFSPFKDFLALASKM